MGLAALSEIGTHYLKVMADLLRSIEHDVCYSFAHEDVGGGAVIQPVDLHQLQPLLPALRTVSADRGGAAHAAR